MRRPVAAAPKSTLRNSRRLTCVPLRSRLWHRTGKPDIPEVPQCHRRNSLSHLAKLTIDVQALEGDLTEGDGPASICTGILGRSRTPMSFAGAARHSVYRGAYYRAAC